VHQVIDKRDAALTTNIVGIAVTAIVGIATIGLMAKANVLAEAGRRTAEDIQQIAQSIGSRVDAAATTLTGIGQSGGNIIANGVASAQRRLITALRMPPSIEAIGLSRRSNPSNQQAAVSDLDDPARACIEIGDREGHVERRNLCRRVGEAFELTPLREGGNTERNTFIDERFIPNVEQQPHEDRVQVEESDVTADSNSLFAIGSDTEDSDLGDEADTSNEEDDTQNEVYFDARESVEWE
jgi:hypothetical protein